MKHLLLSSLLLLAGSSRVLAFQDCVGCTPLNDLGPGLYLGEQGGLYSNGQNVPPPAHALAAGAAAAEVVRRDALGQPDAQGTIGFISISMSNCNQEFSAFERRADLDSNRGAHVKVVNGCQGGQALDTISSPGAPYWSNLAERIDAAGLAPAQVQVAWIKMADAQPVTTVFPDHALNEKDSATAVLNILKSTYPNLSIAFFSSRTYGGNSQNPNRGEPLSYETGFAVKWLIEAQIAGDPDLNHDSSQGPVTAPLVLWGPYLWANGIVPRSDGLVWLPSDFEGDGVHPSADGEQKVARLLEDFFQLDRFATPWYGQPTLSRLVTVSATDDAHVDAAQANTNFGASTELVIAPLTRDAFLKFDTSGISGTLQQAKLSLLTPPVGTNAPGTEVRTVSDNSWSEGSITFANAPTIDGALIDDLPVLSRGTATSFDVTSEVLASWGGPISFALSSSNASPSAKVFLSKEGEGAARLVLTMRAPCADPGVPYCRSFPNSTGQSAVLATSGTASITANNLAVHAGNMPAGVPVLFFYGRDNVQLSFGEGLRCVGGGTARLGPPIMTSGSGLASRPLDFTVPPLGFGPQAVAPGNTIHLQGWYRDVSGGQAGFNLSDAQQILVCP